ncbi:kinetochore component rough deal isoform X2 [Megalopta genalis]|uniref:kinetochore component rough deal isoform X2 n=1 Tax=Megalopta genalis TaxID=115081 RepID=UPI003FD5B558
MALWNKVLTGFDKDEETINFGTRTVAENNGSLYETFTIATIRSDGEIKQQPNVVASVQYSRICVAIDKSITIFENETCEKMLLNASFGLSIVTYYISDNRSYLFVVLSNGVLYCLYLLSGQVIFMKNITNDGDSIVTIFLQHECDEYIVYLIAKSGAIFRVSKFNYKHFEAAISNEDNVTVQELADQIQCTQLFKGFNDNEVIYATIDMVCKEITVAILCSNMLFMWPSEQYFNFNGESYNYTKVKLFKNNVAMLCLCMDNTLNMVCPRTLLGLKVYRESVSDFAIIEDIDNSLCQILILTANKDDHNMCKLRVMSFPDFEEKFQIDVPITVYLVEIMDPRDEIILFLEGINDFQNNTNFIDTIRIKTVSESLPECQLQRLIRKEQFDKAEEFAKKFSLCTEPIYFAKASLLISQFGPWAKKSSDLLHIEELLNIFEKIESVQHIVECCSKALVPDYKQMRKIYLYARTRIMENIAKMPSEDNLNHLDLVNSTLHKLETFHLIWGYRQNFDCYDDDTMKEWIRFSQANCMGEFMSHLNLREMEAATLIWSRHLPDITKYLSVELVKLIFSTLAEDMSPSILWPWLSHFIPTLLSVIPSAICEIITWGCKKVKSFEQSHRDSWPQVGIDFCYKFIKLLKFEENHQFVGIHNECLSKNSNLKQLVSLIQGMSDIKKLKDNYRLTISLGAYMGNPTEVSYILLDKIYIEIIPNFVDSFLKQYMLNNSLQSDYIFSSYVQKIIKNCKSWWSGEKAPWEKRVVMIINLIQDVKTRLQQTLEVLKKASVPWSSTIVNLAEISTNLDHTLASQVKIEFSCVSIKLILKKYGYERIGINSKLICRIIKENHENMISDIQQITKNDPSLQKKAFSSCINYYLSKGNVLKVTEIFNYVETLETNILLFCCIQIVNYVSASLTLKTTPKYIEHYIEMFGWIKLQLEEISKSGKTQSHYCHSLITSMTEIKSLYLLKTEFQIHVKIKEYMLEKKKILENYIEKLCNEGMQRNDNFITLYREIIKVANLLKLEQLDAVSLLLKKTKNIDIFKYFSSSIGGQSSLIPDECPYIYKICLTILQYTEMDEDAAIAIKNLISSALCVCLDNELQSVLSLAVWINLYQECFNKGNKYGLNLLDAQQEETLRTNWKLYTVYKDLAIAADGFMLPLFRDMIFMQQFYLVKQKSLVAGAENSNQELLTNLLNKIRKLRAEHNDYCFLQIVKTLYFNSCIMTDINSVVVTEIKSVYSHFLIILLKKVISSRTFDLYLGLSCLFMLSEMDTCKWIPSACKAYQSDCTRHLRISILAYEYYRLCKNKSSLQIYKDNKMLHSWAQKLSKYSISYKEILTSDATTRREILQRVMHYNDNDMIPLFQDFCTDFDFDVQDCLLIYLQIIITSWNPKLNVSNVNGKEELHIDEDDVNDLKKKCKIVAAKILNEDFLQNSVTTVLSEVNFYYYEVFIILMDLIEDENIERRNYFCFLQNYTRNSQPTQAERDEWMHLNPGYTSLPPIAKWRLPFLPKIELWTSITPELNLKSYEKWLDIAPTLKLQPHILCTLAIKGEVTRTWGNKHKSEEWSLSPKNSSLLNDIKKCIERMTGPNALYYGTAALYYVVNHTPPGADRVAAVEECYKYALLSVKKSTKFEEGMLEKIKFKYFHFTSEHILRTHGLGIPEYLSLIGNPHQLVRELYTDATIPQRYRCITDHRPDINAAVHAINELFPINLVKLRMDLLQEWLQPDVKYMKFNQSITDTFSIIVNSEPKSNSDDNLLRACYILEHGDIELSANFLINIGFGENYENYTPETCYKALHVLQLLVDTEQLENLTKRDIQTIRKHMCSLKYIYRLESLGIMYNINTFITSSKEELVRVLMKTQSHSSQALVLIAQICIDFKIYEYTLWDKNLTELAKLLMINDLKRILLHVRNVSAIVNSNGYLLGWQAVILEPFRKMDSTPTQEQIDNCIEALQLLYSCPVVHMLYFSDIIKYCFQCQQPHLAAAILPFLNDDDKEYVLREIKNTSHVKKLLEDLNKLLLSGILCVSYCHKMIENALLETKL